MNFADYYHLFSQKKEHFWMNDTSLIDCLKRNINYAIQFVTFSWQTSESKWPFTFYEHVQAFTEIDKELQQLKHHQPHTIAAANAAPVKSKIITVLSNHFLEVKIITVALTISVTLTISVFTDDSMDLSSAITAVQGKPISILRIKEICNKWKLCYYCKLQYSDKNIKECFNKKFSTLHLVDIDDISSVDGNVSLTAEKV